MNTGLCASLTHHEQPPNLAATFGMGLRIPRHLVALSFLAISFSFVSRAQTSVSKVWVADNGDGTYKNPILHADYSDPDVIRVGEDFYMTASSFNAVPGLPILHSKDLVNWQLIAHVYAAQPPFDVYSRPQHGNGAWAP